MSAYKARWKVTATSKGKTTTRYYKTYGDAQKAAEELRLAGQEVEIRLMAPGEAEK